VDDRDLWERHAGWWQDGFTDGADAEYEDQIMPLASEWLTDARSVLDVGTGEGQIARLAVRDGATLVVGVDPTVAQLAVAQERGGGACYARANAGALPFPDASFDAVVVCLVFEHIADHAPAIREIARVLQPGGRFLFFLNHPLLQAPNSGWVIDHVLEEQYWRIGPYLVEDVTMEELAPGVVLPRLTPVYTREKVPGADFSTTFGRFEVHGEAVARLVESNGRDDRFQGIAGLNYTLDVGHRWLDQMLFVVEYARETVLRHHRHSDILDSDTVPLVGARLANNAFRDAVVGRIQAKLSEDTVLKLSGIADLAGAPSHYLQFKATHRVTDALHVEAGLDFLTGKPDTFWGRWGDNDRFFVVLRYLF